MKTNNKMERVIVVFGEEAVRELNTDGNADAILDHAVERVFETQQEADAYRMGIADTLGWYDAEEIDQETLEEIERNETN